LPPVPWSWLLRPGRRGGSRSLERAVYRHHGSTERGRRPGRPREPPAAGRS